MANYFERNERFDVTVFGIGEAGRVAIREYSASDPGNYYYINTLSACDDSGFCCKWVVHRSAADGLRVTKDHMQTETTIQNTELLFVIADLSISSDCDRALDLAKLHKQEWNERKYSVLVHCSKAYVRSVDRFESVFNQLISVRDVAELHRPVQMLLTEFHENGYIGLDPSDADSFLNRTTNLQFYETHCHDISEVSCFAEQIKERVIQALGLVNPGDYSINGLVCVTIPETEGLDLGELVVGTVLLKLIDGDVRAQILQNKSSQACDIRVMLLCGKSETAYFWRTDRFIEQY